MNSRTFVPRLATSLGLCFAVSAAGVAFAQSSPNSNDQTLEEVVVTAQKRSESLQETPVSITVVSGSELATRHIYDPTQLTYVAPSLQIESFNAGVGAQVFAVRGVGTLSFASSVEQSVATVMDDVAMGRPEFGFANMSDVQQIEVLNGPQGMLFGKNASAGLVNIKTIRPILGKFEIVTHVEGGQMTTPGDGKEYLAQATLNAPVSENSAIRLNAYYSKHDPFVRDLLNVTGSDFGQKQAGVRLKYLWQPSDKLSAFLAADYAGSIGEGPGATTDRSVAAGSPYAGLDAAIGIVPSPDNTTLSSDGQTNNHFFVGGAQANIDYSFDSGYQLTNVSAYRKYRNRQIFDVDDHQIDIANVNSSAQDYWQFSEELRLSSPKDARVEFQTGLYYFNEGLAGRSAIRANLGGPPPPPPVTSVLGINLANTNDISSYAAFGQATLHVTPRSRLIVGVRETYDELKLNESSDQGGNIISLGLPGVNSDEKSVHKANLSWRAIGQFDVTSDVMAYASAARGYKGPGFNVSFTIGQPPVKPEYPMAYEVGVKSSFLNRKVTLNVSAYSQTFTDFQAQTYDVTQQSYEIANAGKLYSRGFEATLSAVPTENLRVSVNTSYVDAYFGSFLLDQCYAGQPASTCYTQPGNPSATSNSSGNQLPNAPKWTANASADYNHEIGNGLDILASAAVYARTAVNFSSNGDPHTTQAGYGLVDASIGLGAHTGSWQVSAFCRNCLDKRFVTFVEANPLVPTDYGQQFGLNSFRTIGLSVDYRH